jgi:hypothetical protein
VARAVEVNPGAGTAASVGDLAAASQESGAQMARYTRWLVVLTVVLAVLGVGGIVATLVAGGWFVTNP